MKKSTVISITQSLLSIAVFFAILAVFFACDYNFYYKENVAWKVLLIAFLITHMAFTIASQSIVSAVLMMIASIAYLVIFPFPLKVKYFMIVLYLVEFLLLKKIWVKLAGVLLNLFLIICLSIYIGIVDENSWNPDVQTISQHNLVSPDACNRANVKMYHFKENLYWEEEYTIGVSFEKLSVIDIGPVAFSETYKGVYLDLSYEELPDLNMEWVNNTTFRINGKEISLEH